MPMIFWLDKITKDMAGVESGPKQTDPSFWHGRHSDIDIIGPGLFQLRCGVIRRPRNGCCAEWDRTCTCRPQRGSLVAN